MKLMSQVKRYGTFYGYPGWQNECEDVFIRVPLNKTDCNHACLMGSWLTFCPKDRVFRLATWQEFFNPAGVCFDVTEKNKAVIYIKYTQLTRKKDGKNRNVYYLGIDETHNYEDKRTD